MKLIICILGLTATAMAGDAELKTILKEGNDKFTAQMFHQVTEQHAGKSVILSAFSVLSPLAQLALASSGPSHDEILNAIGFPDDDTTKAVFTNINKELRSVKGLELSMANRIYVAQDAALNQNFAAVSREVFNSDVKNVDFSNSIAAAQEINAWVEDNTNHKIKKLVDSSALTGSTRAVLVNAIYFKGSWMKKFDSKNTVDSDFHVSKDKTVQVPTMSTKGDFRYGESAELDAKLLELPYEGGEASFLIVLPNKVDGIETLKEKLQNPSLLDNAQKSMSTYEVDVKLPKFKVETTTDLKDVLEKMNVKKLFTSEASLKNLLQGESDLSVSSAIQKAFIEVNEEGAEAAAANVIIFTQSGGSVQRQKETFVVDRPFFFEIKHRDQTLFNGAVLEPRV